MKNFISNVISLFNSFYRFILRHGVFFLIVFFISILAMAMSGCLIFRELSLRKFLQEDLRRTQNGNAVHQVATAYRNYSLKLAAAKEFGVDVSTIEFQASQAASLFNDKNYPILVEKYGDLSEQLKDLTEEKENLEAEILGEKKKSLEEKMALYKGQGVKTEDVEKRLGEISSLETEKKYNEAGILIIQLDSNLEKLLADKKEADAKAAAAAAAAAKAAAAAAAPVGAQYAGGHSYERKNIATARGSFSIDVLTIDLNAKLRIITDAANDSDCTNNCPTLPLMTYVSRNGGFAGINGTYFCPADYASCAGQIGSFNTLLYNSRVKRYLNDDMNKWSTNPLFTFDFGNGAHFYTQTLQFGRGDIQAAISNHPVLVSGGSVAVNEGILDAKSRTAKIGRGAIGVKGRTLYAVIARGATVGDMAYIMQSLGCESAMNLDGGGSSAMVFNGQYKVGPGRSLPNAIVFAQ